MWTVLKTFRCFLSILLKPASEEGGKLSADANRRGGQPKKVFGPYPWYMANLHKVEDHLLPGRPVFHQPEYFVNHHKQQQQQFISLCPLKRLIYSQYPLKLLIYLAKDSTKSRNIQQNGAWDEIFLVNLFRIDEAQFFTQKQPTIILGKLCFCFLKKNTDSDGVERFHLQWQQCLRKTAKTAE